ncbi:MAG: transporter substrate-binding domain-containing protein [Chloroflexota bacterium]
MSQNVLPEKVIFAYIEEPPFAWTNTENMPTGCDVDVVFTILNMIGIKQIEIRKVTFPELISGVVEQRWTVNTPMFITAGRSQLVQFSHPVWVLTDGFMVRKDIESTINSYDTLAQNINMRVGVVRDQVQHQRALNAGIVPERIQIFEKQEDVVSALLNEQVDVYIATAMGHRAFIESMGYKQLNVVELIASDGNSTTSTSLGGYSFSKSDTKLIEAFNQALTNYIGSQQHRVLMRSYGFSDSEIDYIASHYK